MPSAFKSIQKLLPPPPNPSGLDCSWRSVEIELGSALPNDYKKFIDSYGSGMIWGEIAIWNFRDVTFFHKPILSVLTDENSVIGLYESVRKMGTSIPYKLFPERGGLLPFATIVDVDHLNWLTIGTPTEWDVVYWSSDELSFVRMNGLSFTQFLCRYLSGQCEQIKTPEFGGRREFVPIGRGDIKS